MPKPAIFDDDSVVDDDDAVDEPRKNPITAYLESLCMR